MVGLTQILAKMTGLDRLNNLLKSSICLNLGKAVITTFIELFTLRKPKLIFNYIKQDVRRYLEFDLV